MAPALNGINVAVLFVADLDRARTFYRDTLGLRVTFEDESSAYFELKGASLLLLTRSGAQDLLTAEVVATQDQPGASSQLVAFVDDVNAVHSDLSARGVEFVREPIDREWGMRTAHLMDPDGNIWELAQQLPQSSNAG